MKRIFTLVVVLTVCAGVAYGIYPQEFIQYARAALTAAVWVWDNITANPVPAALALGSFLLTVVYHKLKGMSLRQSVEVAATRVTVVPVYPNGDGESPAVKRAKARTTRQQLLTDQITIQTRQRKLPEEIAKAEKDACYTEKAVTDAEWKLSERRKAYDEATAKLESLRQEQARTDAELAEIDAELDKLAELV